MVRFDKKNFNHNLTGYPLQGQHAKVECASCHKPEYITNIKIRQVKETFLGLNQECTTCHSDTHQNTLGSNCISCHNFNAFSPASNFSHSNTTFPLKGAHSSLDCTSCHKTTQKNKQDFVQYKPISHNNCIDCHNDPHQGAFGNKCNQCHNEISFHQLKTNNAFNHALTGFDLVGVHKKIDCIACHDGKNTQVKYKEFSDDNTITCLTCHNDPHDNKFSSNCIECHDQVSFDIDPKSLLSFDHSSTGFTLVGKHTTVSCIQCHKGEYMTEPIVHNTCMQCHNDYHEGIFVQKYSDCALCHDESGFQETLFDIELHNNTSFPLAGSHVATPCIACHLDNYDKWNFTALGTMCIDCHSNIHEKLLDDKWIPENDCTHCHNTESWPDIRFDHSKTGFILEGKHLRVDCASCHIKYDDLSIIEQNFMTITEECIHCHQNVHGRQFEINGTIDCKRCHSFNHWNPDRFDHNNTRFKLEGAHTKLDCMACHNQTSVENGQTVTIYNINKLQCIDCHQ